MRKLKLEAEELVVETFDPVVLHRGSGGTVHANATNNIDDGCTIYVACTRDESCYWELCAPVPSEDPRVRQC